ncbi:MAG: hypothetical protein JXR61_09140 [Prolixibacteraceae bacterium]|nr:hypothetical protein [Prolixibacteraceae bacterium]
MKTKLNKIFRWILRVFSGLLIAFFLLMFIGESLSSKSSDPMSTNSILQLLLMAIGLTGLGLAWKWELTGGSIALAAFIGLGIINPTTLKVILLLLYPVTAALFIVLWAISKKKALKNNEN